MSRKRIIAKLLAGLPPCFKANRGIVYNGLFRHIVRGILIEGTPYKDTSYLREFTFPLFRTSSFTHLTYSSRLSHPDRGKGDFFSGPVEVVAANMLRAIEAAGLVGDILAGCPPARFLQRHGVGMIDEAFAIDAFDTGCAAGLCGDGPLARHNFALASAAIQRRAERYGPGDHDMAFLHDIDMAQQFMDKGVVTFQAHMDQASRTAASSHGFCPPTISTVECPANAS